MIERTAPSWLPDAASASEHLDIWGPQLRAYYDRIVSMPIPARFTELLGQIESGSAEPRARQARPDFQNTASEQIE